MSHLSTALATLALTWVCLSIMMLTAADFGERVLQRIPEKYPRGQAQLIQIGVTIACVALAPIVFFGAMVVPLRPEPPEELDDDGTPPVALGEFRYIPGKPNDSVN